MAGAVTFVWTEAEMAAALRAQTQLGITWRSWIVMGLLAICGSTIALSPKLDGAPLDLTITVCGAVVAIFLPLCLMAFIVLHTPRIARRMFRQQAALREPVDVSWSDDWVRIESRNGMVTLPWSELHFWALRNGTFLFAAHERHHNLLPVRGLGALAADLEATARARHPHGSASALLRRRRRA